MTGTKDSSPIGETRPEDRRIPFDHTSNAEEFLVIFKDGDHMVFSGRGGMRGAEKDALFQTYIRMSSIAFWDGYLKGEEKGREWLVGDGFETSLGADGTFEKKVKPKPGSAGASPNASRILQTDNPEGVVPATRAYLKS
jgi:hypothetical protein